MLDGDTLSTSLKLNIFFGIVLAPWRLLMKDYNATRETFIRRLDAYVNDQQLLEGILNLTDYQMYKLLHEGVFSLHQWRDYERKDTINFRAMQKLDSALEMPDGYSEQRKKITLVSKIEDVLFERKVRVMDRKLNELLNRRFDGRGFVDANRNVLREGFLRTLRSIFAMREYWAKCRHRIVM
ncbi:putative retrotransposon hot spot protein (RHS) [Trypanosoma cruzi]|uniref:Putative retrotransposon hot spot protein (RHS) n=1 Tax=Trypanosoma cruzi TaxID=5693 RepID=A0A2V2XHS1_TRYCR|nr:putative retrotransposon hot spot protein (RHS) [Trypanosoma cruzi]RNC52575.1 putative retrotransposon hot spot (RHS) protein [Trypanosoma cruzi]